MQNTRRSDNTVLGILRQVFCALVRKWCPPDLPPPPGPPQERRPVYFVPGHISVLVEHSTRLDRPSIANSTKGQLAEALKRLDQDSAVLVDPARVVTFQRGKDDFFSLVFAEAPALRRDPGQLLRTVITLNKPLLDQPQRGTTGKQYAGSDTSAEPNTAGAAAPGKQSEEPIIRRYSPNWTAGGANQNIGGGGPGARPIVPATPISTTGTTANPWDITISGLNLQLPADQRGAGVQVAILDTALEPGDITDAYANWNVTNPLIMPNGLIDELFRPNGPLQIIPGGYSHLLQLANFHIAEQPYVMVDHGTFIAGIIHSIAPQAQLHLIEVLNPLGVGTLETIVRGFQTLADNRTVEGQIADTPPLVVNLSLVLTVPTPGLLEELTQQDPAFQGIDPDALEATILSIKNICDMLHPHNVYFVAAAGNDSDAAQGTLLEADFPAALDNVIGVGALDRNDVAAGYSNIGDRTPEIGLAAFGGVRDASGDADAVNGILGVYTGTFPDGTANDQGLARWAGTSFAAPIISGALAAMLGDTVVHPDPVQELRDSDTQGLLSIGEIVHAQQG